MVTYSHKTTGGLPKKGRPSAFKLKTTAEEAKPCSRISRMAQVIILARFTSYPGTSGGSFWRPTNLLVTLNCSCFNATILFLVRNTGSSFFFLSKQNNNSFTKSNKLHLTLWQIWTFLSKEERGTAHPDREIVWSYKIHVWCTGLSPGTLLNNNLTKIIQKVVGKAIPIKCFVSHRPTDPFFWKSKKKFQNHL